MSDASASSAGALPSAWRTRAACTQACALEVRDDPRPRRRFAGLAGVSAATAAIAACLPALAEQFYLVDGFWDLPALAVALLAGVATMASAGVSLGMPRRHAPMRCKLQVDEATVTLACGMCRRLAVPLRDIESGWVEDARTIVLRTRDGALLALEMPDAVARDAVVAALGISVVDRVMVVSLASSASQLPLGRTLAAIVPLVGAVVPALWAVWAWPRVEHWLRLEDATRGQTALAFAALVALAVLATFGIAGRVARLVTTRLVVVGTDGIVIEEHGRRLRLAHAELSRVDPHPRGIVVETRRGRAYILATVAWNDPPLPEEAPVLSHYAEPWRRREALLRRIREALAVERARVPSVKLDWLDCGRRSFADWRAALRRLVRDPSDYRAAEITREDLVAVAVDGAAAPERRIAAAYALATQDDEARQRVRIAAAACADEHLRAALEEAATGELSERALRACRRA